MSRPTEASGSGLPDGAASEALAAISRVLSILSQSSFDLQQVLQTVVESAVRLTGADQGNVLRQEAGGFRVVAYYGEVDAEYTAFVGDRIYVPDRGTIVGRTLVERRPVHVTDILADPEYRLQEAQRRGGYRTILGVPILKDGAPIGVIVVWRRRVEGFRDADIRLLETFADQAALAIDNVRLYQTIERQRSELARFAPQVAELLTSEEGHALLAGHRREITALFADLRGFTAFAETAEPEDILGVLRDYHAVVGKLVVEHGGTVEHFAGDGLMAFFNDPAPLDDHALCAVRAAIAMRDAFGPLSDGWRKRGHMLGLGIGIAVGYATLGRIGFEGRYDYAAIGSVVNLASRLSEAAGAGEIVLSQRARAAVEGTVEGVEERELTLKGFSRPVAAFAVAATSAHDAMTEAN